MKHYLSIFVICCIFSIFSCNPAKETIPTITEKDKASHKKMVDELYTIANDTSSIDMWNLNAPKAYMLELKIRKSKNPPEMISFGFEAAGEWLKAGNFSRAIDVLNNLLIYISDNNFDIGNDRVSSIRELLGIAYMRKAEIENCINNHTEYSCILPIQKAGQHVEPTGSENASKVFEELWDKGYNKDVNKWLYNVAQMTLGNYPDKMRKDMLIDPKIFESSYDFPRFPDRAMNLGVAVGDISGSVIMDDFNNDYYPDLMVSSYGLDDQLRYFENDTKGGFVEKTGVAGLTGLLSGLNMVQADYNNDGYIDFLILRGAWLGKNGNHPNSLIRNNGDGTFTDVTHEANIYSKLPSQTASWLDVNSDGWIDVFIGNESSPSLEANCELYINNGDGTFKEEAVKYGLDLKAFIKASNAGDYNNDGNPDLYISNIYGENFLMRNTGKEGDYKYVDESKKTGTLKPNKSFSCWFFDYDQDGWEDIFVSGFDFSQFATAAGEVYKDMKGEKSNAELPKLYRNNQDGTFTDVTSNAKVDKVLFTMGCNYGDLDNDGYPDFYAATGTPDFRALIPNKMFRNAEGKGFQDITTAGGFGHLQKGHGVAIGDLDMDGDQDVYTVLGGSYDGDSFMNALFVNPGNTESWLKLKLIGKSVNRAAIGSKVEITAQNDAGENRTFYATVNSGASFGANSLVVELGLGTCSQIKELKIKWNNTISEIVKGAQANGYYTITQGEKVARKLEITAYDFLSTSNGGHIHDH